MLPSVEKVAAEIILHTAAFADLPHFINCKFANGKCSERPIRDEANAASMTVNTDRNWLLINHSFEM